MYHTSSVLFETHAMLTERTCCIEIWLDDKFGSKKGDEKSLILFGRILDLESHDSIVSHCYRLARNLAFEEIAVVSCTQACDQPCPAILPSSIGN
jgi:hypothetical protein